MFHDILELIKKYDRIIIHRHSKPDGDALGSQLGLKYILQENFPEKEILIVGDMSSYISFMEGAKMDNVPDEAYKGALAIVLDTSAPHLIYDDRYRTAEATARFDHHLFVEKICDTEAIDSTFESCCGLITAFAKECDLRLTPLAAKSLYTGMVTDSGRFRYDSTSAKTFRMAAFLMEQPFDLNDIYRNLYADSYESRRLKAHFTLKIQFTSKNVAYIFTSQEEVDALNVEIFTISRGMVSTMADMKGVDIWVNFTETKEGILCELRSSKYNINPIAVKYGGGGHAKASGACLKSKDEVEAMLQDLDAMMEE